MLSFSILPMRRWASRSISAISLMLLPSSVWENAVADTSNRHINKRSIDLTLIKDELLKLRLIHNWGRRKFLENCKDTISF